MPEGCQGSNSISVYGVDSSTGLLTEITGSPFATAAGPSGVVMTGSTLFVANQGAVLDAVQAAYAAYTRRVTTGALNRWFEQAVDANPPPAVSGRRLKLNYVTQTKARPPSFVVFCSRADAVPESYLRYLVNSLRAFFDLPGTLEVTRRHLAESGLEDRIRRRQAAVALGVGVGGVGDPLGVGVVPASFAAASTASCAALISV